MSVFPEKVTFVTLERILNFNLWVVVFVTSNVADKLAFLKYEPVVDVVEEYDSPRAL